MDWGSGWDWDWGCRFEFDPTPARGAGAAAGDGAGSGTEAGTGTATGTETGTGTGKRIEASTEIGVDAFNGFGKPRAVPDGSEQLREGLKRGQPARQPGSQAAM